MTQLDVAQAASLGPTTVHDIEVGHPGTIETYVRIADALHLRGEFELGDPRRREPAIRRAADPVHAAMGEALAARFRDRGYRVGLDEPFQHYQFAGRADVVAWSAERSALLHIENKSRLDDIQDCFGVFNAKRHYLGTEMAARAGVVRWRSETHVMVVLWSAEVLRSLRAHASSFASVFPDPLDAFEFWWEGEPPASGRRSTLIVFEPLAGRRSDRRRWVSLAASAGVRPRYRDYPDAATALGAAGGL